MNEKSNKLYKNTIIFLIGNIGSKIIQFLLVPLYTYTMTTGQYGTTELVFTMSNLLLPLFSIAIADGLLRFGLDTKRNQGEVLRACLTIAFVGSIVSIVFYPLFNAIDGLRGYVVFFLIIMNLQIYNNLLAINLKIQEKNKLFAANSILYTFILGASSAILLGVLKAGIVGYFTSYIIANFISIVFLFIVGDVYLRLRNTKKNTALIKELVIYSLPMIMNAISWWIISVSDRIAINYYLESSDVGIYGIAAKLPSIITTIVGVFSQAWIISAAVEYDNDRDKEFYSQTFAKYYGLVFLMNSGFIAVLRPFMTIYVSSDYRSAWFYAILLISSVSFSSVASFYGGIHQAAKKNISGMVTIAIGSGLNIILNLVWIPIMGIQGAVFATYISWGVVALLRIIEVRKFFDFYVDYRRFCVYIIINLIESIAIMYGNMIITVSVSLVAVSIMCFMERKLALNLLEAVFRIPQKLLKRIR